MSPTVPSVCFRTVEIDIKHQRKILISFFRGGHGLFGLRLATPLGTHGVNARYMIIYIKLRQKFMF